MKVADLGKVKKGDRVRAAQLIEYVTDGGSVIEGAYGTVCDVATGRSARGGFTGVLMINWDSLAGVRATSYDAVNLVGS